MLSWFLLLLLAVCPSDAFVPVTTILSGAQTSFLHSELLHYSALHSKEATSDTCTMTTSYQTSFHGNITQTNRWRWIPKLRRKRENTSDMYQFTYDYNQWVLDDSIDGNTTELTGVMLIHPIGVGISKWYYDRLFSSLCRRNTTNDNKQSVWVAPDLLGSGSASTPLSIQSGNTLQTFPLLNITDWSHQLSSLMTEIESNHNIQRWVLVANGGCSPIALQLAQYSITKRSSFQSPVTKVVLSSPPRLSFFLESSDPIRVQKSYQTLCGTIGKLFWWYALRKNGSFIQNFSERNLVGDPLSLGTEWTPNCIATARMEDGRSKYSTFAFLAGTLQDGCLESLECLKRSEVKVDFIRGRDVRRNRAKSWFWRKRRAKALDGPGEQQQEEQEEYDLMTIQQYIQKNSMGGREVYVDGRISLAWEDADGYAGSIIELLSD